MAAADDPRTGTESADLVVEASYGMTDWFTLSNALSYKKYLYEEEFSSYGPYGDVEVVKTDLSNHVFTERATLMFKVSPKKKACTLVSLRSASRQHIPRRG